MRGVVGLDLPNHSVIAAAKRHESVQEGRELDALGVEQHPVHVESQDVGSLGHWSTAFMRATRLVRRDGMEAPHSLVTSA